MASRHTLVKSNRITARAASQANRDNIRKKFIKDVETYELFNGICKIFPEQKWELQYFAQGDIPIVGTRKERNRISSKNSRTRAKAMYAEMERRLKCLEAEMAPFYEPPLTFDFPFGKINVSLGFSAAESGVWILKEDGWVRKKV